jgi:2-dehydropantoate 2-reductase
MKIGIIGAGGVGGYFGALIAKAGFDVVFIARGKNLEAMREKGLQIKSFLGDVHLKNVKATDDMAALSDVDLIILATKAWQVSDIAKQLKGIIKNNAVVLPLQNGVLAYDELSTVLGNEHVLCGLCRIMSKIESPGVIVHNGIDPVLFFGEKSNAKTERILQIKQVFDQSGIHSEIPEHIEAELWKKFINICVGGLLAVTHCTYGQIRSVPETRKMMMDLMEEIYALSVKAGIEIEHSFIDKTAAFIDKFPFDSTTSLTRDIWEGKPSEIDYQNGSVVRLAEQYGIPVPLNRFVYYCLLPLEQRARSKS